MQRFWSVLAVELGKRAAVVCVVGVLVTVVLGLGIGRLDFATGQDSYLDSSSQVAKDNVDYQSRFGGQAMLTVVTMDAGHRVEELFGDDGRRQWQAFHRDLAEVRRYRSVVSPLMALEYTDRLVQGATPGGDPTASVAGQAQLAALASTPEGSPERAARQADTARTLERLAAIEPERRTLDNPEWVKFLLYDNKDRIRVALRANFPDPTHAQAVTRLRGNLSVEDEGRDATLVQQRASRLRFVGATSVTTGAPILLKDINDYLRGGMLTLGGIAVAIMIVILLVLFDVRWRLLALGVIMVGVVWAFGVAGYLGIPLTIVTIAGLPVMLGVGIDYAIQMHARVEEEAALDRSEHPIQETARGLGPALLVVTFDAVFAFAALRFAKVPMIRQFGLLLAVGIAVICMASIIVPLAVLGIREFRSPTRRTGFNEGRLGALVRRLGALSPRAAVPLAVASIAVFAGGIYAEGRLVLQTDPVQWVNQHSGTIKDIRAVEREVGSSSELDVLVESDDVLSDRTIGFLHDFTERQLGDYGAAGTHQLVLAQSIERVVAGLTAVDGGGDVTPTGAQARAALALAPADVRTVLASDGNRSANIAFPVSPSTLDERAVIVRAIRDDTRPPAGVRAVPSGLAVVGVGLLDNLESNRILLTYLSMAFVFAFLAVRLRSVIRSLLSLVPVGIAVGAASLVAWAAGFKLSPMTAVGGPLVVAACTEFTSLILLRFVEERARGLSPEEAVDVTATRTGRAFIVSALTAIAGVAVLSFSSLPLLRDFGRVVAMNVTVALLSALVVLPPLLVAADRRGWVTRGLIKPAQPFIETPPHPGESAPAAT